MAALRTALRKLLDVLLKALGEEGEEELDVSLTVCQGPCRAAAAQRSLYDPDEIIILLMRSSSSR